MSHARTIQSVLDGIRTAFRQLLTRGLGAWYVTGLLFVAGVALVLAQAGLPRVGLWTLGVTVLAGAGFVLWLYRRLMIPATAGLGAAELAERLAPELGSAPTSAVNLERRSDGRFSRDLIELHLERTADALENVDLESRLVREHDRPRKITLGVLAAAALWSILLLLILDSGRARLATLLLDPDAARVSDVPLTGDIQLTYNYPSYTALPARVVEGDGSITAVVGTEVEVAAVADMEVEQASLRILAGELEQEVAMQVTGGRNLSARVSVLRDASYRFAFVDGDGDRVEERLSHPIRATLDTFPEIHIDSPPSDIELKDDQVVDVLWRARDDFGVSEVFLVLEQPGAAEQKKIELAGSDDTGARREGRYRWSASEIQLAPGTEARFYLEAFDNDTINGPKRSVSSTRRVSLFSARKHHEDLMARQREIVDSLVDWLATDLEAPFPNTGGDAALSVQRTILARVTDLHSNLATLVTALGEDKLTAPEVVSAFSNVLDHIGETRAERSRDIIVASRPLADRAAFARLGARQQSQIAQLERDIIYLDDLLALQRIDELKQTAQELLAAQRNLQELLEQYRQTQDPALRAMLEQQIRELRQRMMELLAKMAQIKDGLPGEYRNLEAANMLKLDDQLQRLEKMLREGDLDAAARELEQLANMLENMVNAIDEAEQEYGGERYAELKKELAEFAQQFRELEDQQRALSKRTDQLLSEYRKKALDQAGKNMEAFIKKARAKAAQALRELDEVAESKSAPRHTQEEVGRARERLLDVDALLQSKDFAEAQSAAQEAEHHAESVQGTLEHQTRWSGSRAPPDLAEAEAASSRAVRRTHELNDMLDRLFPKPDEVLSKEKLAQMQRMQKKQKGLEQQAQELGMKMEKLAGELPLFGGEPKANLESAENEMGQAADDMGDGELPGAAQHKRRAVEELGKLRDALEKASKGGQGGLPMPLGGMSGRQRSGGSNGFNSEPVEIPQADKNRADPRFRKDLLEAAKQKAPDRYQEAVRKYYEELIR